jgi:hypothetical protein
MLRMVEIVIMFLKNDQTSFELRLEFGTNVGGDRDPGWILICIYQETYQGYI